MPAALPRRTRTSSDTESADAASCDDEAGAATAVSRVFVSRSDLRRRLVRIRTPRSARRVVVKGDFPGNVPPLYGRPAEPI
jgi:hypothetical protein